LILKRKMLALLLLSLAGINAVSQISKRDDELLPYGSIDNSTLEEDTHGASIPGGNIHEQIGHFADPPSHHHHCKEKSIRREWRQLTERERQLYLEANQCLLSTPSRFPPFKGSAYDDFVFHHMDIATSIHFTPLFLPFHRAFIIAFEHALSSCAPKFTNLKLTYWDIALDSHQPARAIVFREEYFGGNGNKKKGWCLQTGKFAGRMAVHPHDKCLRRNFDLDQFVKKGNAEASIGSMYSPQLREMTDHHGTPRRFDYFRNVLESTIHEAVHFGVGGAKGDMSKADTAPNDPIFWTHHTNIDRVWSDFQDAFPEFKNSFDGQSEKGVSVSLEDEIDLGAVKAYLPYGWDKKVLRVRDVMDISEWCYAPSKSMRYDAHGDLRDWNGESRIKLGFESSSGAFRPNFI